MITFLQYLQESSDHTISSKDDGFVIKTAHGMIDYRPTSDANEIWWVESKKKGHGSVLVDLMQKNHPNSAISWGVTSKAGEELRKKWHKNNPKIQSIHGEPHEGQFNPYD
jgi:hypothetical protein